MERRVRVRSLRWEAEDVISLELEDADGGPLPRWEPGAHIDLQVGDAGERQYSLCGDPGAPTWRVAVLREPAGRGGSAWVHDVLRPGAVLGARGPRNHFALVDADTYMFIAGGIGITPIMAMVKEIARARKPWRLIYGGRRRASMAFVEELSGLGPDVALVPEDEAGRIDLDAALSGVGAETEVYCCGPPALIDAVVARRADHHVHVERFTPVVSRDEARAGEGFEVELRRSGFTVSVGDGESILEAVEAAGVRPPCSCLEGTCGTCETVVLDGAVDHRDSVLTEAERAESRTMMICVSRAASSRLVLDL